MAWFTEKWTPEKGEKKLARIYPAFFIGEDVWFLGVGTHRRPSAGLIALTPLRLVVLDDVLIVFSANYTDITSLTTDPNTGAVTIVCHDGRSMTLSGVPAADLGAIEHYFRHGKEHPPPAQLVQAQQTKEATQQRQSAAKARNWPNTRVRGDLSVKASRAVGRQCQGQEAPWLILTSAGGAGVLAAFDDRLVIIKTGAATSFMAGSLGGERAAIFHYVDITGLEYNSGFITGVLEILTASYNGSANKDYWRGKTQSRNADSNDPWTLSNTLPLTKVEYTVFQHEIQELKTRISRAKQPPPPAEITVTMPEPAPAATPPAAGGELLERLERLTALHTAGALTDEEFTAAKARLLT